MILEGTVFWYRCVQTFFFSSKPMFISWTENSEVRMHFRNSLYFPKLWCLGSRFRHAGWSKLITWCGQSCVQLVWLWAAFSFAGFADLTIWHVTGSQAHEVDKKIFLSACRAWAIEINRWPCFITGTYSTANPDIFNCSVKKRSHLYQQAQIAKGIYNIYLCLLE